MLYEIRCDAVHEGEFWSFAFHNGTVSMVNTDPDVIADITFDSLRDIVFRGSINATQEQIDCLKIGSLRAAWPALDIPSIHWVLRKPINSQVYYSATLALAINDLSSKAKQC